MPIWDDMGISLDDYAKLFNNTQEIYHAIYEYHIDNCIDDYLKDKLYIVSMVDGKIKVCKVINIGKDVCKIFL